MSRNQMLRVRRISTFLLFTVGVFCVDDDHLLSKKSLEFGFNVWKVCCYNKPSFFFIYIYIQIGMPSMSSS